MVICRMWCTWKCLQVIMAWVIQCLFAQRGSNLEKFNLLKSAMSLISPYSLKQAPRQWFSKLNATLKAFFFHQSKCDYSLFTQTEGTSFTDVLIYVDDLLVAENNMEFINEAKSFLSSQFLMKDLDTLMYFLGLEVDRTAQGIFLSQKKYLTYVLSQYNMTHCKP